MRVYRQPRSGPVRPRLAVGVIAATTAIAVVVAAVVLTVPELIAGQSIGRSDSATSLFGGPARNKKPATGERDEAPAPVRTEETSPPEQTATATTPEPETSPADVETVTTPPPPTTTPGTTAPAP
ncbi:MAG: hypothetical protein H0U84_01800 [Thermoleophilaceae bacterium]|nr:hypothetical protein [Thermoleophilaceae bacterium]